MSDRQRFPLVAKPWIDGAPQFGAADVIFQERQQDEYLEWAVVRSGGRVTRIMFTAEGPEYWRTLALDPALLTKKYNELLFDGRSVVTTEDLYWQTDLALPSYREVNLPDGSISVALNRDQSGEPVYLPFETRGTYNQWNKWNTTDGCVHLIQRNNSLGAEINLAADSTYLYGTSSLTADPEEFMTCAGVGGIRRNSDPNIARDVNQNVLGNLSVTIADPIGLYISDFPQAGITFQGTDVTDQVLTIVRGQAGGDRQRVLRFELRTPEDGLFSLDQCVFDGNELDTGGPIALNTSISIYADAVASNRPNITDPRLGDRPCSFSSLCEHPDIVGYSKRSVKA